MELRKPGRAERNSTGISSVPEATNLPGVAGSLWWQIQIIHIAQNPRQQQEFSTFAVQWSWKAVEKIKKPRLGAVGTILFD